MSKFKSILQIVSLVLIACLMLNLSGAQAAGSPGSAFTYQGMLKDSSGNPITNTCDFQFGLYAVLSGGSVVAGTTLQSIPSVAVTNGYFTVSLDFGAGAFDGNARWLEIGVSCPAGGSYVTLSPRQALTAAPYAIYAVNADLLDGQHAAAFQQHSQNVRVVAKSGGDYTTITAALNSITDAAAANPYLITVAPGVYTETVTMKPYVDIEGAGEMATKITSTGSSSLTTGTVVGASNAELRFLTAENTGGYTYAIAIYSANTAPRLTHITATASGGFQNICVYDGSSSSPTLTNVTASASGGTGNYYGVFNYHSSATMTNVTASVSEGMNNYGVYNDHSSSKMTSVTVTASGGTSNYGVWNDNSSPMITSVTATASGGTHNYGVYNTSASPTITSMIVSASGGTTNYGMWNDNSSATIQNSSITGSGGTSDGIHNAGAGTGPFTVIINNSRLAGGSSTIYTEVATYTTKMGASQLQGIGGQGFGFYKCVSSYNGNFDALNATCQ